MKKEDKVHIVEQLTEDLKSSANFYITDVSSLNVNDTNELRKLCYKEGIKLQMVKNTLIRQALERAEIGGDQMLEVLKGSSSIMFSESINAPAKLIRKFRKEHDKPQLKAAYIEENLYVGDEQVEPLANLKSREELIGDIVGLLNSPIRNVVSALQSGGGKIAGILKTLGEKGE